jgi:hypothetical protein
LKLIVEEIGDGVKPTDHIDKFIDSQFWDWPKTDSKLNRCEK